MNFKGQKAKRPVVKGYFDDDDDVDEMLGNISASSNSNFDEVDPLDAFMAVNEKEIEHTKAKAIEQLPEIVSADDRDYEGYYDLLESEKQYQIDVEYDSDGMPINAGKKTPIEPLPPVDHSKLIYKPFKKDLYVVHKNVRVIFQCFILFS